MNVMRVMHNFLSFRPSRIGRGLDVSKPICLQIYSNRSNISRIWLPAKRSVFRFVYDIVDSSVFRLLVLWFVSREYWTNVFRIDNTILFLIFVFSHKCTNSTCTRIQTTVGSPDCRPVIFSTSCQTWRPSKYEERIPKEVWYCRVCLRHFFFSNFYLTFFRLSR